MRANAYAPAKLILFGEHYVVYGAPGIVAAIEPNNEIELAAQESKSPGFDYHSTMKENDVSVALGDSPNSSSTHPYALLYKSLSEKYPNIYSVSPDSPVTRYIKRRSL